MCEQSKQRDVNKGLVKGINIMCSEINGGFRESLKKVGHLADPCFDIPAPLTLPEIEDILSTRSEVS